jgi:hypothetical protein
VRTCRQRQLFAPVAAAGNKATDLYTSPVRQEGPLRQPPGQRNKHLLDALVRHAEDRRAPPWLTAMCALHKERAGNAAAVEIVSMHRVKGTEAGVVSWPDPARSAAAEPVSVPPSAVSRRELAIAARYGD